MVDLNCILCNGARVQSLEKINVQALSRLYKKRSGVDVESYFKAPTLEVCKCLDCELLFYTPQAIGDGAFYDKLQSYPGYYMEEKSEFLEAAKWISEKHDVLEIGCGSGNFAGYIMPASYTGLEFSADAIEKARLKGLNVIGEDLELHSVANRARYDVVCFFQVLEHVKHPHTFLRQAVECLKPGGKLLLAVPAEDSFIRDAANFYLNMPPHHASKWTDKALEHVAGLNGLQLNKLVHESMNEYHTVFYLKTRCFTRLRKLTGTPKKSVDTGFFSNILYAVAALSAILSLPFVKHKVRQQTGQSVLAIYTKK